MIQKILAWVGPMARAFEKANETPDLFPIWHRQQIPSFNSSDPGFDASLGDLCHRLGASIGFDAVAGEMSARVLRAQPRGSRLLVYGALSLEASQIDPASLIFEGKRVEGFWLTAWLRRRNMLRQLRVTRHVQQMLAGDLRPRFGLGFPSKRPLAAWNSTHPT